MTMSVFQMVILLGVPSVLTISGLFVLFKSPGNVAGRNFLFFNIALAAWNLGDFFVLYFRDYESLVLPAYRISSLGGVFFVAFLVRFHCAVVGELKPSKRIRLFLNTMTPVLTILTLSPLVIKDIQYTDSGFTEVPGPANPILGAYLVWGVLYGLVRLILHYRSATPAKRVQIQYILSAFGFVCVGILAYISGTTIFRSENVPVYLAYYLTEIGYNLLMAYAILQHGALEVKTVIHKTGLWLGTSAAIVVPAIAGLWVIRSNVDNHPVLGLFGVVIICLGLLVYARTVQPYIDHRFQRRRYDLYQTIQRLADELVVLKGVDEVSRKVVETVDQVLYSTGAFITVVAGGTSKSTFPSRDIPNPSEREIFDWLAHHNEILLSRHAGATPQRSGLSEEAVRSYRETSGAEVIVPFVKDRVLLGVLHLGGKRTLQRYSQLDIEFLNRLRTEVTVAYHNSMLFQNVTTLSKQLEVWNAELEQKVQTRTQELEGAYNQLKELDQAKTRFFATVSHELRTPLTLILAPLESLLKGDRGPIPEALQRHIAVMHQNGLRLLKQINNLLDLTKLDAGRMVLRFRQGDLGAFFRGLVASVTPMAERKRIELKGQEEEALPQRTYFDCDRLEKIVLNLLFNAIKFTEPGGRVTLRWGRAGEAQLRVHVTDTGIGIAKADLPKLFKRFSQVDASTNRRYEGTGIGLALAKEIVELHGGRIELESQPGLGSTFTFTIPLVIEPPQEEVAVEAAHGVGGDALRADWTHELHVAAERQLVGITPEPTPPQSPSFSPANGQQVLVVEDNPDMREFIAFELQGEYRVLKAVNGIEGVRVAGEAMPDLIISDVMMPEMDGYQLCREIRKDPRTMHMPIILLTARADMAMKIEGLEHGADDYLTKPFNAQELRAKIKSLLEQRRLEREIQQRNEALEAALEELKATQAQLVQSEKMAGLGMLVAGMAHEINNPINFAKNSLSVLQRAWDDLKPLLAQRDVETAATEAVEDVEASLGIVKNGVSRTEQIVSQLKAFVRKDQNRKVAFPIQEGLASTLELIRPTMGKQIVLHADMQSTCPILAVPGKLNQVWMNLLQNAVQAVGESGEIWVESRDHEHMVTVMVRDSGPGIKPEHLPRLFEPFFTTKPVGQGTGLGLSVSYQIVRDAGGRIDVKSEPGQGAEFTVVLPLAQVLSQAA